MDTITSAQTPARDKEPVHTAIGNTAIGIAGCAVAAFVIGAVFDAAWPGAVAACGISAMGVGVAWFTSRPG